MPVASDGGANGGKPGGVTVKLVFPTTGSNGSMRERNLFTQQTALLEAVVRLKFWRRASDVVATAANQKALRVGQHLDPPGDPPDQEAVFCRPEDAGSE